MGLRGVEHPKKNRCKGVAAGQPRVVVHQEQSVVEKSRKMLRGTSSLSYSS